MDVVWFAEIKWDYLRTRKQQLIRRKPADVRLLFLEPYARGRENRFALRRIPEVEQMWCATVPFVKAVPSGPLRRIADVPAARAAADAAALSRAKAHARRAGFDRSATAAVLSNIYAVRVARRFGPSSLAYDCNDAHAAFPGMPGWTRGYFETACREADTVVATSSALVEEVAALRGREGVTFIGNGVDAAHFERERERLGQPRSGGPPCIGYLGALAPWFDFELVAATARARPDWRVRLVGPVLPGAERDVERVGGMPNVSVEGAVSYDDVPAVMHGFTVGLIPFRYDELTRAVNPNKMYEYLAMGVPVVATRFSPEVRRYPGLVTAAADADEFLVACDEFVSLARDPARLESFSRDAHQVAGDHDWGVIADSFWKHIRSCHDRISGGNA